MGQSKGLGPSMVPMASHMPTMKPIPSHVAPPPVPTSKSYDFLKGMGQNTVSDIALLDQMAGLPFKPLTWMLPEQYKSWMPGSNTHQELFDEWSTPENKEQFMGNLWGSALTPGPDELLLAGKNIGPMMMGMAGGDFRKIAERMGKPADAFTTIWEKNDPSYPPYKIVVKDRTNPHAREAGSISTSGTVTHPSGGDYLSIGSTSTRGDYHDKGFGTELYKELLHRAQGEGFAGLASDPGSRNQFSNLIWDRPGVERHNVGTENWPSNYDFMKEYMPRGKDWAGSYEKNLFKNEQGLYPDPDIPNEYIKYPDMSAQPMLPEVRDALLEAMRNRSFEPRPRPGTYRLPEPPRARPAYDLNEEAVYNANIPNDHYYQPLLTNIFNQYGF